MTIRLGNRLPSFFRLSEEVRAALGGGKPVVALESTVITHGLPFPENLKVAESLEAVVRENGATPATIALMGGRVHVGLDGRQLEELADVSQKPLKVSTRDLPNCLSARAVGGTTVAATMKIASMAGIRVFATGGIGGVHRGASATFDISADLVELSRTPVAVVCAGAKSILDVPKTLELLETLGVNVITFDKEAFFPGFFTRFSPLKSPFNTDDVKTVTEILKLTDELEHKGGTLIAAPLPVGFEQQSERVEEAVNRAIKEADEQKIGGKPLTPFLLKRVNELTESVSLQLNVALLKNNAKIASEIATEYSRLQPPPADVSPSPATAERKTASEKRKFEVLCVGAAIFEFEFIAEKEPKFDGGSYAGDFFQRTGGVARNHAECLQKLGVAAPLVSVVGDDLQADLLLNDKNTCPDHIFRALGHTTASYLSLNVGGNIAFGLLSVEKLIAQITPEKLEAKRFLFDSADYVLLDSNLTIPTLHKALDLCEHYGKKVWIEPTDLSKANRFVEAGGLQRVHAFSPNALEFKNFCRQRGVEIADGRLESTEAIADVLESHLERLVPDQMDFFIVTLGASGVVAVGRREFRPEIVCSPCPQLKSEEFISASGAGDCFNSGFLAAHLHGASLSGCVQAGTKCAEFSLRSTRTVPERVCFEQIVQPFL